MKFYSGQTAQPLDGATWCKASDVQTERRRLITKLLRNKASNLSDEAEHWKTLSRIWSARRPVFSKDADEHWRRCLKSQLWVLGTINTIEAGQLLDYFAKLGADK